LSTTESDHSSILSKMMKVAILFALLGVAIAHHGTINSNQQVAVKKIYEAVTGGEYCPATRPFGVNGTDATYITLYMKDINVLHVNTEKGVFTFQTYFKKEWIDSRLAYNDSTVSYIPLKDCKKLWYPDLFAMNGVQTQEFPYPEFEFIPHNSKFYPNGRVESSAFGTKTIHCPQIFMKDVKEFTCSAKFGSFGYFTDEVEVVLQEASAVKEASYMPGFTFGGVKTATCDKAKARTDEEGHSHACVQVDFKFTRA